MNILDDIYIWSKIGIYSLRFEKLINSKKNNISEIFTSIFKHVKKKGYINKILIFNKNVKINKNFTTIFNDILSKVKDNYQILQLGIYQPKVNIKYNKIISIGSFMINLKDVDLDKFNYMSNNGYPHKIYSINTTLTLHPEKYKTLCILKQRFYMTNFINLEYQYFIENKNNLLKKNSNPFMDIDQIIVSKSLNKFSDRIKINYMLSDYYDNSLPCLFFGIYNVTDLNHFLNHKGDRYIIWGGSDINMEIKHHANIINLIKKERVNYHFAISMDIKKRLDNLSFENKFVNFNLVDESLFKPVKCYGNKIYVYNGTNKGREEIYGKKYYLEVQKRIPEFEFIFSNKMNKTYEEMPEIYKECFIGLRLTKHDGNANTVQEMKSMNIPVVHNGDDDNSLSWNNTDDIELRIRYRNIELFNKYIKKFNKILFICSDYPNYGGAATNTTKMIDFYEKMGKKVFGVFHSKDVDINYETDKDNIDVISNRDLFNYLSNLEFKPDLIILRNYVTFDIKKLYKCSIYFLIPGIFGPKLSSNYNELSDQELKKYINRNIINTIRYSDKSYCASAHTRDLLLRLYKFKINILYFNYIPYYGKFIEKDKNFDKRKYDYGIIVSDFDRKIKNTEYFINRLKNTKFKVILIGNNSSKYDIYENFSVFDNIGHDNILYCPEIFHYMKKIKIILQNSFYESCSNVYVESRFNGCLIKKNIDNSNNLLDKPDINFISDVYNIIPKLDNYNFKKKTKILIISTQYPYYGGAATCAYHSLSYLKKLGYKVCCIYFSNIKDIDIDPKNFGSVIQFGMKNNFTLKRYLDSVKIKEFVLDELSGYPDIIFGWNYGAPLLIKTIFPFIKLVYVITGIPTITLGSDDIFKKELSVSKVLLKKTKRLINYDQYIIEKKCINISNICLPYTKLIEIYFSFLYKKYLYKLYPFLNTAVGNVLDNTKKIKKIKKDKNIDLIAVASNWFRKVKNLPFLIKVYKEFPKLKKIIIGLEINENNKTAENLNLFEEINSLPNTTILPKIPYDKLQEYISSARLLLITSISESGPNVLLEAFYQNCQVISSKNIGFFNLVNKKILCNSCYNLDEWKNKIDYIFKNYDNLKISEIDNIPKNEEHKMIEFITHNKVVNNSKIKVVFVSCDVPNHGGSATNTYNLYMNLNQYIDCYCIFISNIDYEIKPENKDRFFVIKVEEINLIMDNVKKKISKGTPIDIVFFKNYKVYVYIFMYFKNIIKLFSPSGLRGINKIVSENDVFVNDKKVNKLYDNLLNKISNKNIIVKPDNIFNLLKKYELCVEEFVFRNCDYILTNSKLTRNIVSKISNINIKLLNNINLTNINYKLKKNRKNYNKRKFDLGFICYNWKRKCKNYDLVMKIINNKLLKNYKIVIVGLNQKKNDNKNITCYDNLDKKDMFELMNDIKIVVITSLYDSNPNVLIEAVSNGCNIITSPNVGGNEYINQTCIVYNYNNIDSWINTIIDCNRSFSYYGPNNNIIKNDLLYLFKKISKKKVKFNDKILIEAVGIYKIPAKWDNYNIIEKKTFEYFDENIGSFRENINRITDINDNIYFNIFENIIKIKKIKNSHYIFIDDFSSSNYHFMKNGIHIWVLNNINSIYNFNTGKLYFIRGCYHKFYKKFIPEKSFKIFYPATSFKYNYNFKKEMKFNDIKSSLKINNNYNYDVVLSHEDKNYRKVYNNSKLILFEKFPSKCFYYLGLKRLYDIIFVADSIQVTKNHCLMNDFLKYCEDKEFEITVAYVSNKNQLSKKYKNFVSEENLKYVKLRYFTDLTPDDLNLLYNKSKINLVLSGRDCCPRVISESLVCGCFNIALSTLSDGKFYYRDIMGKILFFDDLLVKNMNRSLCYVKHFKIFFNILYFVLEGKFDHENISKKYLNIFSNELFYKKLISLI
jgi:hypothetical protein